jgi:predicted metalloprotease with PDZ domain
MKKVVYKKMMVTLLVTFVWVITFAVPRLHYTVSFDPAGNYLNVELHATQLEGTQTMFKLPVWAPGYYRIMDYPKNIVDFAVSNATQPLLWEKVGKSGWLVKHGADKSITVTYRVFADAQSVADAKVTLERAFIPGNGVYMYIENQKELPVTVTFNPPPEWKRISTGLDPVPEQKNTYRASDFDILYDTPVLLGNHTTLFFDLEGRQYEMALETPEGMEETTFVDDLKRMISASTALIGGVPYQHYCFLFLGPGGGGLEHINSQASFGISFRNRDRSRYLSLLSFVTHEYFHLYNVKTIRPIELGPFDYDKEVFTSGLWISEGFTSYYESIILRRAGIITSEEALREHSGPIRSIENAEGKLHMSLRQSSYDIWLNFFNRSANGNTRISYYTKGQTLGLLTDIAIRQMSNNAKSLDDVMRSLYHDFHIAKGRGFTEEEYWQLCAEMAGAPLTEIREYVDTTKEIDYAKYLGYAGVDIDMTPLPEQGNGRVVQRSWQMSFREDSKCSPLQLAMRNALF